MGRWGELGRRGIAGGENFGVAAEIVAALVAGGVAEFVEADVAAVVGVEAVAAAVPAAAAVVAVVAAGVVAAAAELAELAAAGLAAAELAVVVSDYPPFAVDSDSQWCRKSNLPKSSLAPKLSRRA